MTGARNILLIATLCLFAATGMGLSLEQEGETDRVAYASDLNITFAYESDRNTTFWLEITRDSNLLKNESMNRTNITNGFRYTYEASFDAGDAGNLRSEVVEGDGDQFAIRHFHLANETPQIFKVDREPAIPSVDQEVNVTVTISDAGEDIDSIDAFAGGTEKTLEQVGSGTYYERYSFTHTESNEGEYEYNVSVQDTSGRQDVLDGVLEFFSYQGRQTEFNVTIENICDVTLEDFTPPGIGGAMAANTTGNFTGNFSNFGKYDARLSYNFSIHYQDESAYDSFDELGEMVANPPNETGVTILGLNAEDASPEERRDAFNYNFSAPAEQVGWYTGYMEADGACFENPVVDTFEIRDFTNVIVLEVNNTRQEPEPDEGGGEEGEPVEGDDPDAPGVTPDPVPEPVPEPVPQPEPTPILSVDMRTLNASYTVDREEFANITMEIRNFGDETLENFTVTLFDDEQWSEWQAVDLRIDELGPNESVVRDVFLQPSENVEPGQYFVPMMARREDGQGLDVEYIAMNVREQIQVASLALVEFPSRLEVTRGEQVDIPVLVENIGSTTLDTVLVEMLNVGRLGTAENAVAHNLSVNDTAELTINYTAGDELGQGNVTILVSTATGAFEFAEMTIEIVEEDAIVPEQFRLPLVASLWTLVLVLYALIYRIYDLEEWYIKLPLVILILGEVVLMLSLGAEYYGFSSELLPF